MKSALGTSFALGFLVLFLMPTLVLAAGIPYWGPLLSCTGNVPDKTGIPNSLPHCESICDLLVTAQNILRFAITLALFAIAPLLFAWGAILLITSGGSPEIGRAHV